MNNDRQSRIKKNIELRARLIRAVRSFFTGRGYLEVETPNRIPAPAPEAHIDAMESGKMFLHTSPELCMKRLLAAGYEKIFQICKCWRRHERGKSHLPELTMLEWYTAGEDYHHMMDQCEALVQFISQKIVLGPLLFFQGNRIDLTPPWEKLTVEEAFNTYGSISLKQALAQDRFDEILGCEIEPRLGTEKPVILYEYPASGSALARLKPDDPSVAERFELYIGGLELCNAFTELTDPAEQIRRFEKEIENRKTAGKQVYPMPGLFLKALERMPQATGNALGLDRLAMLFADTDRIDDVVTFTPEEL